MTMNASCRFASLLFAILPMLGACTKQAPGRNIAEAVEAGPLKLETMQSALSEMPPECVLGAPGAGPSALWVNAPAVANGSGSPIVHIYTFDEPIPARALHVALNRQALRDLEKMETRDSRGGWSDAGMLASREAPAACDYVWLEQELPNARQVQALRLSFRSGSDSIATAAGGVLPDIAG